MSETKITETELHGLKRMLRPIDYHRDHLAETLEANLGSQYATLLARRGSLSEDRLSWWVAGVEKPIPFMMLSATEKAKLLQRLEEMRVAVGALADRLQKDGNEEDRNTANALRKALIIPSERSIWSLNGQPVLIEWGYEFWDEQRQDLGGPERASGRLKRLIQPGQAAPEADTSASVPVKTPPTLTAEEAPRLSPLHPFAWLPFLILLGAIYWMLLKSCGIIVLPILDRCEWASASELERLEEDNRGLLDQIRSAELQEQARQSDCASLAKLPQPEPVAPSEAEDRVKGAGGQSGILEITLVWNSVDDLDLHVTCPGGIVNYSQKTNCSGGQHDIDMNAGATVPNPVEHVVWQQSPPPGSYNVQVKLYSRRTGASDTPINFVVEIRDGSDVRKFPGTVSIEKQPVDVTSFEK